MTIQGPTMLAVGSTPELSNIVKWGFPKIGVPYFGVLLIRILLFRVLS